MSSRHSSRKRSRTAKAAEQEALTECLRVVKQQKLVTATVEVEAELEPETQDEAEKDEPGDAEAEKDETGNAEEEPQIGLSLPLALELQQPVALHVRSSTMPPPPPRPPPPLPPFQEQVMAFTSPMPQPIRPPSAPPAFFIHHGFNSASVETPSTKGRGLKERDLERVFDTVLKHRTQYEEGQINQTELFRIVTDLLRADLNHSSLDRVVKREMKERKEYIASGITGTDDSSNKNKLLDEVIEMFDSVEQAKATAKRQQEQGKARALASRTNREAAAEALGDGGDEVGIEDDVENIDPHLNVSQASNSGSSRLNKGNINQFFKVATTYLQQKAMASSSSSSSLNELGDRLARLEEKVEGGQQKVYAFLEQIMEKVSNRGE